MIPTYTVGTFEFTFVLIAFIFQQYHTDISLFFTIHFTWVDPGMVWNSEPATKTTHQPLGREVLYNNINKVLFMEEKRKRACQLPGGKWPHRPWTSSITGMLLMRCFRQATQLSWYWVFRKRKGPDRASGLSITVQTTVATLGRYSVGLWHFPGSTQPLSSYF